MSRPPKPLKKLGQHFLTDPKVIDRIIENAELSESSRVLEVGPGRGALTSPILRKGAELWAAEKDTRLGERLQKRFDASRFYLIPGDVLRLSWEDFLQDHRDWIFLSNIPYNITAPLFFRLIRYRKSFSKIHIMVQKEVGENIFHDFETGPSKNYGTLSIICDAFFEKGRKFVIPPGAFSPPPKVQSMMLELFPKKLTLNEESLFCDWIKMAFSQRRKKLKNNSHPIFREVFERLPPDLAEELSTHRPEEVSPERWRDFYSRANLQNFLPEK